VTPRVAEGGAGDRATPRESTASGYVGRRLRHLPTANVVGRPPQRRPVPRADARHALPLLLLVVLSLAPTIPASAAERSTPIPAGEPALEIKLGDQHGRAFALADILRQRAFVVLAFYPKAFTSG
jgi:hypothetical protein